MDNDYMSMLAEALRNSHISAAGEGGKKGGGGQLDLRVPIGDVGVTASGSGNYSPYGKNIMLNRVGADVSLVGGRVGVGVDPNNLRNFNINYNRGF